MIVTAMEERDPAPAPCARGDERYRQQSGPWREAIGEVMRKYVDCGIRGFPPTREKASPRETASPGNGSPPASPAICSTS